MIYKKSKVSYFRLYALAVLLFACSISRVATAADNYFSSEVTGITQEMLESTYWQTSKNKNKLHYSVKEIQSQNNRLFRQNSHMNNLIEFPGFLSGNEIHDRIRNVSKRPSTNRYLKNGQQITEHQWQVYESALNLAPLTNTNQNITIRFARVIKRTALRTFPTIDAVFKNSKEINLDRFQETALFPSEIIAIMHQSANSEWLFVSNYNYSAWIKKEDIAEASKKNILNFSERKDLLIVTGDKVFTNFNPHDKTVSQIQLDMGVKLPLVDKNEIPLTVGGQNTYASYVVYLPTRNQFGKLEAKMALIPRNKDVRVGYLPFTEKNIIDQSFKFLGERYGWGHSFNARDCTGFVGDIYKSFGILMPRNTGQQAMSAQGQNVRFSKSADNDEKLKEIRKLNPGDLIYIPGHVMMFLGLRNNDPYIIHDVSGFSYYNEDGNFVKSKLNGVSVTPLLPLQLNAEKSYLDDIYSLKKLRP